MTDICISIELFESFLPDCIHYLVYQPNFEIASNTTVVLTEKAIAFCNDKTETWLDVAFANKTKPKYESTEQLVAKGLFPGAVALPEPSRASQSPAAFECSQALEGTPPLFSEVRRDSLCPHDG